VVKRQHSRIDQDYLPPNKRTLTETEKAFLPSFPANRFSANWEEQVVATASTNACLPEVGDITSKERWTMKRTLLVVASHRSSVPSGMSRSILYLTSRSSSGDSAIS